MIALQHYSLNEGFYVVIEILVALALFAVVLAVLPLIIAGVMVGGMFAVGGIAVVLIFIFLGANMWVVWALIAIACLPLFVPQRVIDEYARKYVKRQRRRMFKEMHAATFIKDDDDWV